MVSGPAHYLLDTNVLSETYKRRESPSVRRFLDSRTDRELFLSVLSLGEIWKGIAKLRRNDAAGARRLEAWAAEVESSFSERILGVDAETARLWGEWSSGRTRPVIDTLLAATAARHGLTLVTRNTADVADLPVRVVNPWTDES